jgi:hypothetical protein
LNTDANLDNGEWCSADPKMNGNGGGPWYLKFTKSGTGLWQFRMTSFRNTTADKGEQFWSMGALASNFI